MKSKGYKEVLEYCLKFEKRVFGFGYKPDYYNKFDWVKDGRLEDFIKKHDREIGLIRLGGDVTIHRDKDVSKKVKMIILKDFVFEIDGKKELLIAGDLIEFNGSSQHQGWNCYCLVMWNRKVSNNQICIDL